MTTTIIACIITAVVTAFAAGIFTAWSITREDKEVPLIPGSYYLLPNIEEPVFYIGSYVPDIWFEHAYYNLTISSNSRDSSQYHIPIKRFKKIAKPYTKESNI